MQLLLQNANSSWIILAELSLQSANTVWYLQWFQSDSNGTTNEVLAGRCQSGCSHGTQVTSSRQFCVERLARLWHFTTCADGQLEQTFKYALSFTCLSATLSSLYSAYEQVHLGTEQEKWQYFSVLNIVLVCSDLDHQNKCFSPNYDKSGVQGCCWSY